jgi:glycosyltransferase involved in cell wall biosynthesis
MKGTRRRAFRLLVTISTHLARDYQTLGVPSEKILVLPDAVDLNLFTRPTLLPDRPYAGNRPVVTYAGHLYDYKGIPTILQAAQLMPEVDFHLIGGLPDDLARYATTIQRDDLHNVFLHGICPHAEVPPFLWHADVLLLVPSAHHPSAAWTSPIKLGEYLASGTPVVATSIPALRDWLTDEEVHFVEPDEPQALADGIRAVLTDQEHARQRSQMGLEKSKSLSYPKRAGRILEMAGVTIETKWFDF